MFSTYPALGSYINRAGRVADIGEDAIYDLFDEEPKSELPTLTDARLGMLAKQQGYGNDDKAVLDYIDSVVNDPRFTAYTEAYAKEGKNAVTEYRYTVEMSMGMETAFDKVYDTKTRDKAGGGVTLATPIEEAAPVVTPPKTPVHESVMPVTAPVVEPVEPVQVPVNKPTAPKKLSDYVVKEPVYHASPIWEPSEETMPERRTIAETVKATAHKAGTMVRGFIKRLFGRG